jgi:hypothetical protein
VQDRFSRSIYGHPCKPVSVGAAVDDSSSPDGWMMEHGPSLLMSSILDSLEPSPYKQAAPARAAPSAGSLTAPR